MCHVSRAGRGRHVCQPRLADADIRRADLPVHLLHRHARLVSISVAWHGIWPRWRTTDAHRGTSNGRYLFKDAQFQGCLLPLPSSVEFRQPLLPHLQRDTAHPSHIRTTTGLTPATSAPGLGLPLCPLHRDCTHLSPHLRRDWARSSVLCPLRSTSGIPCVSAPCPTAPCPTAQCLRTYLL